ncbi:hypothetical protein WJX77_004033 [Trebouxia sp. C0004]
MFPTSAIPVTSVSSSDSLVKHDVITKPALEKSSSSKKLKQGVAKVVHKVADQICGGGGPLAPAAGSEASHNHRRCSW